MPNLTKRLKTQFHRSRKALYTFLIPLAAVAGASMWDTVDGPLRLIYIVLGFSLIIFLHELGHFVVARLCSVKCLAFSLGIGPRIFGWRKGAGISFGADPFDPDTKNPKRNHPESTAVQSDLPTTANDPPHARNVGDTDYRVSWFPLGGYVRMLGQDDMDPTKISDDPHSFNRRPIWQRMCIVSAGVIMNVIFAAVVFSIIFRVGIDFPPAVVGMVEYGSPAEKAGLQMGDRVTAINGAKPTGFVEFTDVQIAAALAARDDVINITYERPGVGKSTSVDITPEMPPEGGFLRFGVGYMPSLKIVRSKSTLADAVKARGKGEPGADLVDPATQKELERLQPRDEIVAVDGIPLSEDPKHQQPGYKALYDYLQTHGAMEPVKLTVHGSTANGGIADTREISLRPQLELRPGAANFPTVLGMGPRLIAGKVLARGPADKAGMKDGDIIERVGERRNPSQEQFKDVVEHRAGVPLKIEVLRDGELQTLTATPMEKNGKGLVNLAMMFDLTNSIVAVRERRPDVQAVNDADPVRIAAVDGTAVKTWYDVYDLLKRHKEGDEVKLSFAPVSEKKAVSAASASADSGTPITAAVDANYLALPATTFKLDHDLAEILHDQMHYQLNVPVENYMEPQVAGTFGQAVMMGGEHTKKFILQVYMTLAGLFRGTVSPDNLHGIVGITKVGYEVQERGPGWLWYVLAMVSVNLAVANFLPLPIVDGGLFLLLILEKIRGKPLSLKVQSAIQVVGIVLLGGLFLFVTWNDIGLFGK